MYIKEIKIKNYKSFWDSNKINFKQGINIIVGKNNSGKTALLEALSLEPNRFKPHRSLISLPSRSDTASQEKIIELIFNVSDYNFEANTFFIQDEEFQSLEEKYKHARRYYRFNDSSVIEAEENFEAKKQQLINLVQEIIEPKNIDFTLVLKNDQPTYLFPTVLIPYNETIPISGIGKTDVVKFSINDRQVNYCHSSKVDNDPATFIFEKVSYRSKIYAFRAERLNVSESKFGDNSVLENNASNLAEVLNHLQSNNHERFKKFNEYVNAVFPRIKYVSVRPKGANLEIFTWVTDPKAERNDLTIPLSESGTGVGQILSILYVVVNSNHPQVIIIDEPQSFLHPSAIRTLVEIFQIYDQHQYIISTHSPVIISSASPSTINLIRIENHESVVYPLDMKTTNTIKHSLMEIGTRLSDVFGLDAIIWVEGPTEEEAFKTIITTVLKERLRGISILSVAHTGDFDGKNTDRKKTIMKIYNRLSTQNSLLPPALKFIFDREDRTEEELNEMKKLGDIIFTKRRLFENYLLDPASIAKQINSIENFSEVAIDQETIEAWFEEHKWDKVFWKNIATKQYKQKEDWKQMIHAAKFLGALYSDLSKHTVTYRKTKDSVDLAAIIAKDKPHFFEDIAATLKEIITNFQEKLYVQ